MQGTKDNGAKALYYWAYLDHTRWCWGPESVLMGSYCAGNHMNPNLCIISQDPNKDFLPRAEVKVELSYSQQQREKGRSHSHEEYAELQRNGARVRELGSGSFIRKNEDSIVP